jgi:hypothetical protein
MNHFRIVCIPWAVPVSACLAEHPDILEAADDIHEERIVEIYCHEQKRRQQEKRKYFLISIDIRHDQLLEKKEDRQFLKEAGQFRRKLPVL